VIFVESTPTPPLKWRGLLKLEIARFYLNIRTSCSPSILREGWFNESGSLSRNNKTMKLI
jgi:hypothetical protein